MKEVKIKIERQGAPIVNTDNALIQNKYKDIVAICVDLKSKYCEVDAIGTSNDDKCGAIFIGTNDESIQLKNNVDRDECTKIYFPQYPGWDIFSYSLTRYTLRVCLIKNKK